LSCALSSFFHAVFYRKITIEFAGRLDHQHADVLIPNQITYTYNPLVCDEQKDECCALRKVQAQLGTPEEPLPPGMIERCNHQRALANYKQGKAFVFLHHITHHAGTFLCKLARKNVGELATPPFVCNLDSIADINRPSILLDGCVRFCAMEKPFRPKDSIPFGSDKIVFIHILRHPIARFLVLVTAACRGHSRSQKVEITPALPSALSASDNYALRFISGAPRGHLNNGKPDGEVSRTDWNQAAG
jgi:hypothetical protein